MDLLTDLKWVKWVVLGAVVSFVALLFVVFPLLILVVAMVERQQVRRLIECGRPAETRGKTWAAVNEAVREAGFELVGTFTDREKGLTRGVVTIGVSPDRRTMLWSQHNGGAKVRLITRLADGRRVISSTIQGTADLTGMDEDRMYGDVPFVRLYAAHGMRIAGLEDAVVPYEPSRVVDEILELDRSRVARMVEMGMARYRSDDRGSWVYRARGAVLVAIGYLRSLSAGRQAA